MVCAICLRALEATYSLLLVPAAFAVTNQQPTAWLVPFYLFVIHMEGLCSNCGDINRLMMNGEMARKCRVGCPAMGWWWWWWWWWMTCSVNPYSLTRCCIADKNNPLGTANPCVAVCGLLTSNNSFTCPASLWTSLAFGLNAKGWLFRTL
jgi:hypothetical protein